MGICRIDCGGVKMGILPRHLVTPGFSVHPVRFQSSFGRSLHYTHFDTAYVDSRRDNQFGKGSLGLNYMKVRPKSEISAKDGTGFMKECSVVIVEIIDLFDPRFPLRHPSPLICPQNRLHRRGAGIDSIESNLALYFRVFTEPVSTGFRQSFDRSS